MDELRLSGLNNLDGALFSHQQFSQAIHLSSDQHQQLVEIRRHQSQFIISADFNACFPGGMFFQKVDLPSKSSQATNQDEMQRQAQQSSHDQHRPSQLLADLLIEHQALLMHRAWNIQRNQPNVLLEDVLYGIKEVVYVGVTR